jgi:molybdate transport system substrate-binding protein
MHPALFRPLVLLALLALSGCGGKEPERIHFYAAASMTDAVSELAELWNDRGGIEVVPVFAGSSTLARQIREGAPAELFLSASQQWMDYLVRETDRVRSASRLDLLANHLVLVVPPGNPGGIESVADLADPFDGLALGDPEHVPAGIYAADWLRNAGLWQRVQNRLRPAVDVRAALAYVERGEVDAGLVYLTDARLGDVEVIAQLDPKLHPPIRYPLALIEPEKKGEELAEEVLSFHRWLLGETAGAVFRRHGFDTLSRGL